MLLQCLLRRGDLSPAQKLARAAANRGLLGVPGLGALLSEVELCNDAHAGAEFLMRAALNGFGPSASNVAAAALATAGEAASAVELLRSAGSQGLDDHISRRIALACGIDDADWKTGLLTIHRTKSVHTMGIPDGEVQEPARKASDSMVKIGSLLPYALRTAPAGDAAAVCEALEQFREVLGRRWLKIAGGSKADIIKQAVRRAPRGGLALELGTYFGYTALRLSLERPGSRVLSIEVDPVAALSARCLIMHAGAAHNIEILIGHSRDMLPRLSSLHAKGEGEIFSAAFVFMDQCGSCFWEDLETLVHYNLLMPGAIIVADNVLKPGAPLFLWEIISSAHFDVLIISVPEFGMPGVEDWMVVATYRPENARVRVPDVPTEIHDFEWEAHLMRLRAQSAPGVDFVEWAAHAARMRKHFLKFNIGPELSWSPG